MMSNTRFLDCVLKLGMTAMVIAVGGTISLVPQAHADEYDYVGALDHAGVYYSSINDVIDLGKAACRSLRMGNSVDSTLSMVSQAGYPPMDTALIVGAATYNMCRDVQPPVLAWARAHGANVS